MGKRGPKPGNGGRPPKTLNIKVFEGLCRIQCTEEEIASILDMDRNTLEKLVKQHYNDTFSATLKKNSAGGKASLRRTQIKMSETNPTMAIWLGKQYLGQRDKNDTDITSGGERIKSIAPHTFVETDKKNGE